MANLMNFCCLLVIVLSHAFIQIQRLIKVWLFVDRRQHWYGGRAADHCSCANSRWAFNWRVYFARWRHKSLRHGRRAFAPRWTTSASRWDVISFRLLTEIINALLRSLIAYFTSSLEYWLLLLLLLQWRLIVTLTRQTILFVLCCLCLWELDFEFVQRWRYDQ